MARYERNRGMFFASWSGISQEEIISIPTTEQTKAYSNPYRVYKYFLDNNRIERFKAFHREGTYRIIVAKFLSGILTLTVQYKRSASSWARFSRDMVSDELYVTTGIRVVVVEGTGGQPQSNDVIVEYSYSEGYSTWEAIGKDNDSLLKELNPDTEKIKNVLGELAFRHRGYQPEISVDRYYVDENRKLYKRMVLNAIEEKRSDNDLKGFFAEAFFMTSNKDTMTMTGYCYVRQAFFVPQSTGGDTSGLSIPFTIVPIGSMSRKSIEYHMNNNEAFIK